MVEIQYSAWLGELEAAAPPLGNIVGGVFIMMIHPNRIRQVVTLCRGRKRPSD